MAGGVPVLAASAAPPTVTIAARSAFPVVTGDVFVLFRAAAHNENRAQIHGKISGASPGQVARLFAQTFPFRHPPVRAGAVTLTHATSAYSFTVAPSLATRYRVEVFKNGTSTTPVVSSAVSTVFVSNLMMPSGFSFGSCSRPVCRQTIRVVEFVPPSTLRTEIAKRWFFYFGLSLSPTPPRFLTLDTRATISRPVRISAGSFKVTISWSFRIGNSGFTPSLTFCNKDTESADGLGLPGHHSCGANRISATIPYLG